MACCVITPYEPTVYNDLPSIRAAHTRFQIELNENDMKAIGEVFVRHNMHENFGITLMHRHLKLEPEERMVFVKEHEVPSSKHFPKPSAEMVQSVAMPSILGENKVSSSTLKVNTDGSLTPYEFESQF